MPLTALSSCKLNVTVVICLEKKNVNSKKKKKKKRFYSEIMLFDMMPVQKGQNRHVHIQGVSKKRGPFLKMLKLLHLLRKFFQIFCGCSKLILLCNNDVLLSGGAAIRK